MVIRTTAAIQPAARHARTASGRHVFRMPGTHGLSLRLWVQTPPAGSTAGKLAAMLPGWWGRCPACTQYQLQHQWGVNALPGFGDEQWRAMLTPLLRAIFSPDKPAPRKPVDK